MGKSGPKAAGWQGATLRQVRAGKRTARWAHVVGPLARWTGREKEADMDEQPDGDTPDGRAGRGQAGGLAGRGLAGRLAGRRYLPQCL